MSPLQMRAAGGGTRELWAWRRGEGIRTAGDSREGSFGGDVVLLSIHMGDSGGERPERHNVPSLHLVARA
jgi:hypothetical protein